MGRYGLALFALCVGCGSGILGISLFDSGGSSGGGGSSGTTTTHHIPSGLSDATAPLSFPGDMFRSIAYAQGDCTDGSAALDVQQFDFEPPPGPASPPDPEPDMDLFVWNNPGGPERISAFAANLDPNTRYSMFFTSSEVTGALPAVLIAEFTTTGGGFAMFSLELELFEAFIAVPDQSGVGCTDDNALAGALTNFPEKIQLDRIRIYVADGAISIFSACSDDDAAGGGHVLSLALDLP